MIQFNINMPSTKVSQKLKLLLLSLVTVLLILEIGLRLSGWIILSVQDQRNKAAFKNKNNYRVLCIGESTTFLGGEDSYPNQLQKSLNTSSKNKQFTVINKGIPGIGTAFILSNVNQWMNEYNPDIVVAMMGINDHNTLIPVDQVSLQKLSLFKNLRVYKLTRWLTTNVMESLKSKTKAATIPATTSTTPFKKRKATDFEGQVAESILNAPPTIQKLYAAGLLYEGSLQDEKAEDVFKALIQINDNNTLERKFYLKLGSTLLKQKNFPELIGVVDYLLVNPYDANASAWINAMCDDPQGSLYAARFLESKVQKDPSSPPLLDLLGSCHWKQNRIAQAETYFKQSEEIRLNHYNPTTKTNYLKLNEILNTHGVSKVFVQYPLRDIKPLKKLFISASEKDKIIFVDNYHTFKESTEGHGYTYLFTDRFAGNFGHCTKEGNHLLAQNIANAIIKDVLK